MPTALIDGIATRFEIDGSGPPLLMFSPGGFDSNLEAWRSVGIYQRLDLMRALTQRYTCITFDRRESGHSGGRMERIAWADYVAQGIGLVDHLGIDRVHLMGGCVGCSTAIAFSVAHPSRVVSMVLYSPAGGVKYRLKQLARFGTHLSFVRDRGLSGVVELCGSTTDGFTADPRVGPWASTVRRDAAFAREYARFDGEAYDQMVSGLARVMFDRDTVPGAEPEDLLRLQTPAFIVPGQDTSHATSAARYLQECLPCAEYWDAPVVEQTAETAPPQVLGFLDRWSDRR